MTSSGRVTICEWTGMVAGDDEEPQERSILVK